MIRSLVLSGCGINCEEESAAAWELAGAEVDIVHLKDLFSETVLLDPYDIIFFPGGFSFGDDLGGGRVLANRIKYRKLPSGTTLFKELKKKIKEGGYLLGICNGFQVLLHLGLLPTPASLTRNHSNKFEDRWVKCKVPDWVRTPLLPKGIQIDLPVRHGEGCLTPYAEQMEESLIALQYVDESGHVTGHYPLNPNGSWQGCAALTDPTGHVLGMMPHPEAFLSFYNHPDWPGKKRKGNKEEQGEGLKLFRHMVLTIEKEREAREKNQACAHQCLR